jgi:hypothetical protein
VFNDSDPTGGTEMSAGQKGKTGAINELDDETVMKNDILGSRDKTQRHLGQSLDSEAVQGDKYKDLPSNRRPNTSEACTEKDKETRLPIADESKSTGDSQQVDRPGFDLGGATGKNQAGRGLGLGTDATEDREGQRLPRDGEKE